MQSILKRITDQVSTRKGTWVTLGVWVIVTVLLAVFAPSAKEYESSNITSLPSDAKSVIAQNKLDQYFKDNDGIPAILVFPIFWGLNGIWFSWPFADFMDFIVTGIFIIMELKIINRAIKKQEIEVAPETV